MGKQKPKKSSGKQLTKLEKVLLATAITNLISAMISLAGKIIDMK